MSQIVKISSLGLSNVPAGNVTATIWYRVVPDPDFLAPIFILVTTSAIILPNGDLQTPVSIGGLPDLGTVELKAKINCSDTIIKKTIKLPSSGSCVFYLVSNAGEEDKEGGYADCLTGALVPFTVPGSGSVGVCARKNSVTFFGSPENITIEDKGSCKGGTTTTTTAGEVFPTTTTTTVPPATTTTTTVNMDIVGKMVLKNGSGVTWDSWLVKVNGTMVGFGGSVPNSTAASFDIEAFTGATVEVTLITAVLNMGDGDFSNGAIAGVVAGNKITFTLADITGDVALSIS